MYLPNRSLGVASAVASLMIFASIPVVAAPPAFTSTPEISAIQDTTYTYHITAEDPDEDALTYSAPTKPAWLSFVSGLDGRALIQTVAGDGSAFNTGDDGTATNAAVATPAGIAADEAGNLFMSTQAYNFHMVRRIDANSGIITTIAGKVSGNGYNSDGIAATEAWLSAPSDVAVNSSTNVFIADMYNHRIRKVDSAGIIHTIAGTGIAGFSGDGGASTNAQVNRPYGVALDGVGNVYIADTFNHRVRKIDVAGTITTIAGTGFEGYTGDEMAATNSALNYPKGIDVDAEGNIYIGEAYGHRVRKVDTNGTIHTIAGTGSSGFTGDGAAATNAKLNQPGSVDVDDAGNVYIADASNQRIRRIDAVTGIITSMAGNGVSGFGGDGGSATNASLAQPLGVAITGSTLYISDTDNNRIRVMSSGTQLTGAPEFGHLGDHPVILQIDDATTNTQQSFTIHVSAGLTGMVVSGSATVIEGAAADYTVDAYFSDGASSDVSMDAVWTVDGSPPAGTVFTNNTLTAGYVTSNTAITIRSTYSWGNVVTSETHGVTIRNLTLSSVTVTGATSVVEATTNTYVCLATFGEGDEIDVSDSAVWTVEGYAPFGTAFTGDSLYIGRVDSDTNIVIKAEYTHDSVLSDDTYGVTIQNVNRAPVFHSVPETDAFVGVAYTYGILYSDPDGEPVTCTAPILPPWLTFADTGGGDGVITTFAGTAEYGDPTDGVAATNSSLNMPYGLGMDNQGRLYIADTDHHCIRRVDPASGVITTVVGSGTSGFSGDGGAATNAQLNSPHAVTVDGDGNIFIADTGNYCARRVDAESGIITTVAGTGSVQGFSGDGGAATNAQLTYPKGIAVDGSGNVFVADYSNDRIRKVDGTTGIISTLCGNGFPGFSGDDGPASAAQIDDPQDLAIDSVGNLYVADQGNNRIRRIDAVSAIITTVAGNGLAGFSGDGAAATNAMIQGPDGLCIDAQDNIFIVDDGNNRVRRVDGAGIITTIAGNGGTSYAGDGGAATNASMYHPTGLAVDAAGNVYLSLPFTHRVRRVGTDSFTLYGTPDSGDVVGTHTVKLDATDGMVYTQQQFVIIVDYLQLTNLVITGEGSLREGATNEYTCTAYFEQNKTADVTADATWTVESPVTGGGAFTGNALTGGPIEGDTNLLIQASYLYDSATHTATTVVTVTENTAPQYTTEATTNALSGVLYSYKLRALDLQDDTYTMSAHTLPAWLSLTANPQRGLISTYAGTGATGSAGDGGLAVSAQLNGILDLAVDGSGNLYIADALNYRIRKVDAVTSNITTVAGNGTAGYSGDGGPATNAQLRRVEGVDVDAEGNIYIADSTNHVIRRVDADTGAITTYAGSSEGFSGDGGPATSAQFSYVADVAVDRTGHVYVADRNNNRIRRIDAVSGVVTTIAGSGNVGWATGGYSGDGGPATNALLDRPQSVAVDTEGNVVVDDFYNQRIRRIDNISGLIETVAGGGVELYFAGDTVATNASLSYPESVSLDADGNIYAANPHRVWKASAASGRIRHVCGSSLANDGGDGGPADSALLNNPLDAVTDAEGNIYIADTGNNRVRRIGAHEWTLSGVPGPSDVGLHSVVVGVSDGAMTVLQSFDLKVWDSINVEPSFNKGTNVIVNEDCGGQLYETWATAISAGPGGESDQLLTFSVTNNNNGLFAVQPAVATNGTLTFTPAADISGTATVSVVLSDNGATFFGGDDTSAEQFFTIVINTVNDEPSFTKGADDNVYQFTGARTVTGWATSISAGPGDESGQLLTFSVTNNNNGLFVIQPAVAADGTLTYTQDDSTNGAATISVVLKDNGGTANGGDDTSAPQFFTIVIADPTTNAGAGPTWWYRHNVLILNTATNVTVNDYAAVNQGQVKWIASQAYNDMTNHYGQVSSGISNIINSFSATNNYQVVNIGQLKWVAEPFYLFLSNSVPWTGTNANDFAPANIGQVKNAFNFEIP